MLLRIYCGEREGEGPLKWGSLPLERSLLAFCSQPCLQECNLAGNISNAMRLDVKWLDIGRKGGLVFKSSYVYVRRKEKAVLKDSSLHNN